MRRRLVRFLLSAALLCSVCGCGHETANTAPDAAPLLLAKGVVTESNDTQVYTLRDRAATTPLTVSDVDWLLSVATRKSSSPWLQGTKLDTIAHVFVNAGFTRLPASRRSQVFAFASDEISFWESDHPVVVYNHLIALENVPMGACLILREFHTDAASAQLQPLLTSPNTDVREFAQKSIAKPNV